MRKELSDKDRLIHILEAIWQIEEFAKNKTIDDFVSDKMLHNATLQKFVVIGEAVANLTNEFIEKYNTVKWYKPKSFRNFIVHEYFGINLKQVWNIIKKDLPELQKETTFILDELKH